MSADNYYVVRKHPNGGFTHVMGFASDEDSLDTPTEDHPQFATKEEAFAAASDEYSEYGVSYHPECLMDTTTFTMAQEAFKSGDFRSLIDRMNAATRARARAAAARIREMRGE